MKNLECKKELFNKFLNDNKKLISFSTSLFKTHNSDPSINYEDFQQDAKLCIMTSIECCENPFDIIQLKKMYKTQLFHLVGRVRRHSHEKMFSFCESYDEMFDQEDINDHTFKTLDKMFVRDMFYEFLKYMETKYGTTNREGRPILHIVIFKELINPSDEFLKIVRKSNKDDRINGLSCCEHGYVTLDDLATHFGVSPRAVRMAVKKLKEIATAWMSKSEKKDSISVKS